MPSYTLPGGTIKFESEKTNGRYLALVASGGAVLIDSVSGDFGQGNTITLSGSFSAARNGQLLYATGDTNEAGNMPSWLVDFDGTHDSSFVGDEIYRHNTERSFSQSGASFKAKFPATTQGTTESSSIAESCFRPASRSRRMYVSAEVYHDFSSWDSTDVSQQMKHIRILSQDNNISGRPYFLYQCIGGGTDAQEPWWYIGGWGDGTGNGTRMRNEDEVTWGSNLTEDPSDRKWNRFVLWTELPDPITDSTGKKLVRIVEHHRNKQVAPGRAEENWMEGNTSTARFSWDPPAVHNDPDAGGANPEDYLFVTLPFYQRGIHDAAVWVDCLYVNDTPERIELGNQPVMDDCTKLVVQKQASRTTSEVQFECEEGNFTASDDVYVFACNDDGSYSDGYLLRAGA